MVSRICSSLIFCRMAIYFCSSYSLVGSGSFGGGSHGGCCLLSPLHQLDFLASYNLRRLKSLASTSLMDEFVRLCLITSQFLKIAALNLHISIILLRLRSSQVGQFVLIHLPTPVPHNRLNATHGTTVSRVAWNFSCFNTVVLVTNPSTMSLSSPAL